VAGVAHITDEIYYLLDRLRISDVRI